MHDVIVGQPRLNWWVSEAATYEVLQKKATIAVAQYKRFIRSPVEAAIQSWLPHYYLMHYSPS